MKKPFSVMLVAIVVLSTACYRREVPKEQTPTPEHPGQQTASQEAGTPGKPSAKSPLTATIVDKPFSVVFTNNAQTTVKLLKPLDGSLWGWIMPHYKFTVEDSDGKVINLRPRCGLFGHPYSGTKWPDDYVIVLEPGQSQRQTVFLPHDISASATYTVSFQYIFPDEKMTTPGGDYPPGLWTGTITAEPVKLQLEPTD